MPSRVRLLNRKTQICAAAFLVCTLATLDSIDSISQRVPGQPWCCDSAGSAAAPRKLEARSAYSKTANWYEHCQQSRTYANFRASAKPRILSL